MIKRVSTPKDILFINIDELIQNQPPQLPPKLRNSFKESKQNTYVSTPVGNGASYSLEKIGT